MAKDTENSFRIQEAHDYHLRLQLAMAAPHEEIANAIPEYAGPAAEFIGVSIEEYNALVHYPMVVAKARVAWADALIAALNKKENPSNADGTQSDSSSS